MKNKVFKDYINNLYSEEENYKSIISKFEETSNVNRSKIKSVVAMFIIVILFSLLSGKVYAEIKWNIEFKEYQNRNYETGLGAIKDDEYLEEVDMDYIEQNGIKAKVNSLFITDDEFKANIDFEFDESKSLDLQSFNYAFAVYDENKDIYAIDYRILLNTDKEIRKKLKCLLKDIGVKYKFRDILRNPLANQAGIEKLEVFDRNIVTELQLSSVSGFPKSKKIYIRIFDLGYDFINNGSIESVKISDDEWIFEIDVPEKFYERVTTNLELKESIPNVRVSKLAITEHGLQLTGTFNGINDIIFSGMDMKAEEWNEKRDNLLYITDEKGNRYNALGFGTYKEGRDSIHASFDINKSMLKDNVFYLNYTDSSGNLYTRELIEKIK